MSPQCDLKYPYFMIYQSIILSQITARVLLIVVDHKVFHSISLFKIMPCGA